jgi:hypothetical protein
MRTRGKAILGAGVLLVASTACRKEAPVEATSAPPSTAESPPERAVEADAGPPLAAGPRIAPSRCRAAEPAIALEADAAADDLELGDAVEATSGYAVSLLHRTARGLGAAVAFVGAGGGRGNGGAGGNGAKEPAALIDLGPTLGDAPPPRLLLAGSDVIAGAYSIAGDVATAGGNDKSRRLSLYDIRYDPASGGQAKAILEVPQQRDDSLAFDIALGGFAPSAHPGPAGPSSVVVVWDEASRAGHGVIRSTTVPLPDRMSSVAASPSPPAPASGGAVHDVSPPESDAEVPRVVTFGVGSVVLWIARRPEPGPPADAAEVEATGEPRSFGWLESVALDERGAPAGPVRRLTPASGHVSAYDVRTLPAAQRPTLLVVARDDGEAVDASGGELLRVRIVGDTVEPPVAFPSDGLGRGGPALVDGDRPWLVWIGPHEQLRLLPLDAEGAPAGKPSAEDEMSEARPLLFLRDPNKRDDRAAAGHDASAPGRLAGHATATAPAAAATVAMGAAGATGDVTAHAVRPVLVASPLDAAAQLRVFDCVLQAP